MITYLDCYGQERYICRQTLTLPAMNALLPAAVLIFLYSFAHAQEKKTTASSENYRVRPVWIQLMDQPDVNYYEAVKAFDQYWEGKIEPEEESELITEGHITTEQADSLRRARALWTQAERNEYELLKYHFKRFKDWKRTNFPFVQSDGRILSEQERLEIWQKQQSTEEKK